MVEHIAPLRFSLGTGLAGVGIRDHVCSKITAQRIDSVFVAAFQYAGKVHHAVFERIERVPPGRIDIADLGIDAQPH